MVNSHGVHGKWQEWDSVNAHVVFASSPGIWLSLLFLLPVLKKAAALHHKLYILFAVRNVTFSRGAQAHAAKL